MKADYRSKALPRKLKIGAIAVLLLLLSDRIVVGAVEEGDEAFHELEGKT